MIPAELALRLIAALIGGAPTADATQAAQAETIVEHAFVVSGMNCPICPHLARDALERLDGVQVVASTPSDRRVLIQVRNGRTDEATLLHALAAAGFRARVAVSASDGSP